jgi:hypothetical protein
MEYQDNDTKEYIVTFMFFKASTNTRIFDNKKDIDKLVKDILKEHLVEKIVSKSTESGWKFYEFIAVRFDVYEMDSPIGAPIKLPQHLLTGSNQQYLIKYNTYDDNLCFWRCLAYCIYKPDNNRRVKKHVNKLFNEYYENK